MTASIDNHAYLAALDQMLPALTAADPVRALGQLAHAIRRTASSEESHFRDLVLSGMWRESIGDRRGERSPTDLDEGLIERAIELGRETLAERPARLRTIVEVLGEAPATRRIAIMLLAESATPDPDLLESAVFDTAHMDAWLGEYRELVRRHYRELSIESQAKLLELIKAGPRREGLQSGDPGELARRRWIYRHLMVISVELAGDDADLFTALEHEFGAVDEASWTAGELWVGPTSPVTEEWLEDRTPAEVADYLEEWRPPGGFFDNTPAGLSRALEKVVGRRASEYADHAELFLGLHATYVRALFSGLREAVVGGQRLKWESLLVLATAVTQRPVADVGTFGDVELALDDGDADPDWSWARRELASLIAVGAEKAGTSGLQLGQAEAIWEVLDVITEDLEPTVDYEAQYGRRNMDWSTVALNTVRPVAFGAMFDLWDWLAARDPDSQVLERIRAKATSHLISEVDPSLAVRAVYGRRVPTLLTVDANWLRESRDWIFPPSESERDLWWSAWAGYLAFWRAHRETFALLENEYRRAIGRLGSEPDWRWLRDPDEVLGQHLVALYASGAAQYGDWLEPYFGSADPDTRGAILSWVGRATEAQSPDVTSRLMRLWDARLAAIRNDPSLPRSELAAFGWWFSGGQFAVDWSFSQLQSALGLGVDIEADFLILGRLSTLAEGHPEAAAHTLLLMVDGLGEQWHLLSWADDMGAVLSTCLTSSSLRAREEARQVISLLAIRHGLTDYRRLLAAPDVERGTPASDEPR